MPLRLFLSGFGFALLLAPSVLADKLHISSNPPGAAVEIDGKAGTTPFEEDFPGGYFHDPFSLLSHRLSRPLVARISLEGYVTKEIALTIGPREWVSSSGHKRFQYYLFRATHFHVDLDSVDETFTGTVTAVPDSRMAVQPGRPLESPRSQEEVVQQSKRAVVHLKGNSKGGSGFFVTETGVIVTNAHVVRGEDIVFAELADGQRLEARVVYEDPEVDVALAKVKGRHFPHLTLAEVADVQQGENVIAIGSPGGAMSFSVTKGIVSAVGPFPSAGPGTWIETDTAINPGSSGGPLLNSRGEAIGMSTQKLIKENVSGIGFALSSSNLLVVLRRFYPKIDSGLKTMSSVENDETPAEKSTEVETGTVLFSEPDGAEIWVDHAFVGKAPARLPLSVGQHVVAIKVKNHADWITSITIVKGSQVTLSPEP